MADETDAPDFSTVPEQFITEGKPDLAAYRTAFDEAVAAREAATGFDPEQIPEQFAIDGKKDLASFRLAFDELASFKAREDERLAALPKKPEDVAFTVPEDLSPYLPEGFEMPKGEDGNPIPLEIDDSNPLVAEFRKVAVEEGISAKGIERLRDIVVRDNISRIAEAGKVHQEQMKLLGPNAQARVATVTRALQARLPEAQAKAIAADITTADTLRALETILTPKGSSPVSAPGGKPDLASMTPKERLAYHFEQKAARRSA